MSKSREISVDGLTVEIIRKDIKNLHLRIYPPDGRIRMSAPLRVSDDAVRLMVESRLGWIKRKRAKFAGQERQSARAYVSGENHWFLGCQYRLNVIEHSRPCRVAVGDNGAIDLLVRDGSDQAQREKVFLAWYGNELKALSRPLVEKWAHTMELTVPEYRIKRMKTRWGTCNIRARRIWLNLELIMRPRQCTEFIIVHELAHFYERLHNDRFTGLMDEYLPQWRLYRDELNSAPLSHEHWGY